MLDRIEYKCDIWYSNGALYSPITWNWTNNYYFNSPKQFETFEFLRHCLNTMYQGEVSWFWI